MSKTFLERLEDAREGNEIAQICLFNTGEITEENRNSAKRIKEATSQESYWAIEDVLLDTAKGLIHIGEFSTIEMNLMLGLIYDSRAYSSANAKPIQGVVRYYTGDVKSDIYGDLLCVPGELGSTPGRQGYIDYSFLLESIKQSGLKFTGPESFQEFEEKMKLKRPFSIKISATLKSKEKEKPATR